MPKNEREGLAPAAGGWGSKSNALNEVRNNHMTISQIRLFTAYLSKIDPKRKESRKVAFRLEEYARIMQFEQGSETRLMKTAGELLGLTVRYWDGAGRRPDGHAGFEISQIFKRIKLCENDDGEWHVSIDCHDDAARLIFGLRKDYFRHGLWNALQLTSFNQQRIYELLKRDEAVGERTISMEGLREWLGLEPHEYREWQNFKTRVLNASQEALAQHTDIKFAWEVVGKVGKGGKISALRFVIEKNDACAMQLALDDFMTGQWPEETEDEPEEIEDVLEEIEGVLEEIEDVSEEIEGVLEEIEGVLEEIEGVSEEIEGEPEEIEGGPEEIRDVQEEQAGEPEVREDGPEAIEDAPEEREDAAEGFGDALDEHADWPEAREDAQDGLAGGPGADEEGDAGEGYFEREIHPMMIEVCGDGYGLDEMKGIYDSIRKMIPDSAGGDSKQEIRDYLEWLGYAKQG